MKKMRNMLLTYSKEENHTPKTTYYYEDELNDDFAFNGIDGINRLLVFFATRS